MTVNYSSISFNTIAPSYNAINAIPAEAASAIGRAVTALAAPNAPILDMGCGAGRIALPAATAGARMFGIDIERAMLNEAHQQAVANSLPLSLINGTITQLPFADASFAVVLSINVLHLVPEWQQVLNEAVRVMQPGGIFVQGRDWLDPESCAGKMRSKLREIVGTLEPGLRPTAAASPVVLARALEAFGGTTEPDTVAASWVSHISPAALLDQMAKRGHNETWMLNDALLAAALEHLHTWATETWTDIEADQPVERRFTLTVTRGMK